MQTGRRSLCLLHLPLQQEVVQPTLAQLISIIHHQFKVRIHRELALALCTGSKPQRWQQWVHVLQKQPHTAFNQPCQMVTAMLNQ